MRGDAERRAWHTRSPAFDRNIGVPPRRETRPSRIPNKTIRGFVRESSAKGTVTRAWHNERMTCFGV
ncbi:hypothetical protein BURPSPAST_J0852 [Burkholderia pseudomallei Pasteur 52237]|uniref:Uncharacterized protein n=1 Tax=Burkholderia pseudomallei 1710a TaxID=320371 RepID=A0A0E1VX68_BURPE|nr:hypothetical protein BURPSPAST_J0852 [Burkholderia pseudomallei Pasteur 52237]EET04611.1 hypothetical protein BURPS1710A_A0674 [Burkholderia pseudomallei 1710a]